MITPAERAAALVEAAMAYADDLDELDAAGCDHRFAEYLSSLPDPDTDGAEHD